MKVLLKILLTYLILNSATFAADEFTGDTKLACEAILCLSSGTRPSECMPSLTKFFSIIAKKPWETIQLRKNFLQLCPTDQNIDINHDYANLIDTLSETSSSCDADTLNKNIEEHRVIADGNRITKIRVNPNMPDYCVKLARHHYTDIKRLKYTCDTNKFYDKASWDRGYELIQINQAAYNTLSNDKKEMKENPAYSKCNSKFGYALQQCMRLIPKYLYFEKKPVSKVCWVD